MLASVVHGSGEIDCALLSGGTHCCAAATAARRNNAGARWRRMAESSPERQRDERRGEDGYDVKSIRVREHARGRQASCGGLGRGGCLFDSSPRARQRTGIIDACSDRAVQELMDGKQRRLRGKDKLERLICRAEN